MKKLFWIVPVLSLVVSLASLYHAWDVKNENHKLSFLNSIFKAEIRFLKEDLDQFQKKPTYDQGYKDALISVGGPQSPGAYQNGWNDAYKVFAENKGYSDGYHAAIQQFQYQTNTVKMLVPNESTYAKDE